MKLSNSQVHKFKNLHNSNLRKIVSLVQLFYCISNNPANHNSLY
jgi:hypothetical protein